MATKLVNGQRVSVPAGDLAALQAEWDAFDPLAQERAAMVCSRFQAKAALANAGLLSSAESLVANSSETVKLAWAEAIEFKRLSPTIIALAGPDGLDLTDEQIDALFRAAMQIEA